MNHTRSAPKRADVLTQQYRSPDMALTLYGAILSPFVRKVRILLAEHQIP